MPQGAYRRIQKTGGSTYIVSLPKKWVEGRLKKGDSVRIVSRGDELVLSVQAEEKKRDAVTLEFQGDLAQLTRQVIAHYLAGFDKFSIRAPAASHAPIKKTITEKVPGLEVLDETGQGLEFQNLLAQTDLSFGATLSRLVFLNQTLLERLAEKIQGKNGESADLLEREVDRFFILAFRQLANTTRENATDQAQSLYYVIVIKSLEKIADHGYIFSNQWQTQAVPKTKQKKFERQCETAKIAFQKATQALLKKDAHKAQDALAFIDAHHAGFEANDFLSYNLLRILDYSADIAEMALDLTSGE